MGNNCLKSKINDSNKPNPSIYSKLIHFDVIEKEYNGLSSTFYSDMDNINILIPYIKDNKHLNYLIESYLECPLNCNSLKCGQCSNKQCNNIKLSIERCEQLKKHLIEKGCQNHFEIKAWGCTHPEIKKDLMKMSLWVEPETPLIVNEPVKIADPVIPINNDDGEYLKKLAELEEREKALKESEEKNAGLLAQLKSKELNLQKEKEKVEEKLRNAEEVEKKAKDHESQAEIALAEAEKRLMDSAEREKAEREALEAEKKKFEEQLQQAQDEESREMLERKKEYEESLHELEKKKQEAELAAREAEKRKQAANAALAVATAKKQAYEAAAEKAEEKRIAEERMVANIILEIEETLKEEIEFVKNQASLTPQGESICAKVVPFLLRLPDMIIHIESHTNCVHGKCDHGCYLMELSQQRVDTVRSYFIQNGCKNEFITKGWGCKHPELHNIRLVRIFPEKTHKKRIVLPASAILSSSLP